MKRIAKPAAALFIVACLFLVGAAATLWYVWSSNLPYIGSLREYHPPVVTELYSEEGEVIGRFWDEKRIVVPLDHLPKHLVQAFIAAEDARFYEHEGVDVQSILRALINNVMAGRIEQGGSTITQQVAKSLLLKDTEKTYRRKVREATLSLQIEKEFSKERILYLYLNQIYLGQGAYGVEAAARTYFDKNASELNLAESAILAGLTQAPSRYSLFLHFSRAKARQKYVLERMREEKFITPSQEKDALASPIHVNRAAESSFDKAPYFTEHVRRTLENKYGREALYREGLKIYTTLSFGMQRAAQAAVEKGLLELDKREGYRGPLRPVKQEDAASSQKSASREPKEGTLRQGATVQALVEKVDDQKKEAWIRMGNRTGLLPISEMKWAKRPGATTLKSPKEVLKAEDLILVSLKEEGPPPFDWTCSLEQAPEVQAALLAMEAHTGRVRAMVGGRDFWTSQFNRAIQAKRQPGSAFKPIIYAAALDWGMTPSTVILDAPYLSSLNPEDEIWRPKNFKEKFLGPTLFRTALVQSRNVITVKILRQVGIPYALSYAKRMGVESEMSPDLSLALGSSGLSLSELIRSYAVFANGGSLVDPIFVHRVLDRHGNLLEENVPAKKEVISSETAYVMTDLLKAVISEGTGWRSKSLKRPAAGKTGTTNDLRDAWFVGYTPHLVAGVWVGYDDRNPMNQGETGSRAANPIWLYFMAEAVKNRPSEDFPVPPGVVMEKIDPKTGLLAGPHSGKPLLQAFKAGQEPK
ncbi:MAG: penicillin-binding protein 1A, partial [Deltaproteobacteria bacterium]